MKSVGTKSNWTLKTAGLVKKPILSHRELITLKLKGVTPSRDTNIVLVMELKRAVTQAVRAPAAAGHFLTQHLPLGKHEKTEVDLPWRL